MLMQKAINDQGLDVMYSGVLAEPSTFAIWGQGFNFTYFEVDAATVAINNNYTIYVGNSTTIYSNGNAVCSNM
jgi:hypothetical protein